jgi:hypothetical protein
LEYTPASIILQSPALVAVQFGTFSYTLAILASWRAHSTPRPLTRLQKLGSRAILASLEVSKMKL